MATCGNCGREFENRLIDLHVYWCYQLNLPAAFNASQHNMTQGLKHEMGGE